jgi:hypothetical protein
MACCVTCAAAALLAALPALRGSFNYIGELDGSFEGGLCGPAAEPSDAAQSPHQRRPHALAVSLLVASGRPRVDWGYSALRPRDDRAPRRVWGLSARRQPSA